MSTNDPMKLHTQNMFGGVKPPDIDGEKPSVSAKEPKKGATVASGPSKVRSPEEDEILKLARADALEAERKVAVSASIPESQHELIRKIAKQNEWSLSEAVAWAIKRGLQSKG